jgi:hypothetical protein
VSALVLVFYCFTQVWYAYETPEPTKGYKVDFKYKVTTTAAAWFFATGCVVLIGGLIGLSTLLNRVKTVCGKWIAIIIILVQVLTLGMLYMSSKSVEKRLKSNQFYYKVCNDTPKNRTTFFKETLNTKVSGNDLHDLQYL